MEPENSRIGSADLHGADLQASLSRETFSGALRRKTKLEIFHELAGLWKPAKASINIDKLKETLSCAGQLVVKNITDYYTSKGWEKEVLLVSLCAFFSSNKSNQELKLFTEALNQYIAKGWKLSSLLNSSTLLFDSKENLEMITPAHLTSFGISYAVLNLKSSTFSLIEQLRVANTVSQMIASEAAPELCELFCWFDSKVSCLRHDEAAVCFITLSRLRLNNIEIASLSRLLLPLAEAEASLFFDLRNFIQTFAKLVTQQSNPEKSELRSIFNEGLGKQLELGFDLQRYLAAFSLCLGAERLEQTICKLLNHSSPHHSVGYELKQFMLMISYIATHANSLSEQMISNYIEADKKGLIKNSQQSFRILAEIIAHSSVALGTYAAAKLPEEISKLQAALHSKVDIEKSTLLAPASRYDVDRKNTLHPMLQRVIAMQARMRDINQGFGALAIEASKLPGEEACMLARFASELGSIMRIHASNADEYPGAGYVISKLDLSKIFVKNEKKVKYPFRDYQEAWPYYANEFMDLANAEFVFTRGFIAVSVTSDKYALKRQRVNVPYSYVIFNEHYHNYQNHTAFLVPTKILREEILPCTTDCDPGFFDKDSVRDINQAKLSAAKLLLRTSDAAPILNIGSGANLLGGFGFSHLPNSNAILKLINLENVKQANINIFGYPNTDWSIEQIVLLQLEDQRIFELINRYQNVFDLFKIAQALWHKGFTSGRGEFIDSGDLSAYESDASNSSPRYMKDQDHFAGERSFFMLNEAFRWHNAFKLGLIAKERAPILTNCDTRGYATIPQGSITLDTADLSLQIGAKRFMLSGDSSGPNDTDKLLWVFEVMPKIKDTFVDIRFYKRDALNLPGK